MDTRDDVRSQLSDPKFKSRRKEANYPISVTNQSRSDNGDATAQTVNNIETIKNCVRTRAHESASNSEDQQSCTKRKKDIADWKKANERATVSQISTTSEGKCVRDSSEIEERYYEIVRLAERLSTKMSRADNSSSTDSDDFTGLESKINEFEQKLKKAKNKRTVREQEERLKKINKQLDRKIKKHVNRRADRLERCMKKIERLEKKKEKVFKREGKKRVMRHENSGSDRDDEQVGSFAFSRLS